MRAHSISRFDGVAIRSATFFLRERIHLSGVGLTHHRGEKPCGLHRFVSCEMFNFELQMLAAATPARRPPAPGIVWRASAAQDSGPGVGAFDYTLCICRAAFERGYRGAAPRRRGLRSFLDVHQAHSFALIWWRFANSQEHGIAQAP